VKSRYRFRIASPRAAGGRAAQPFSRLAVESHRLEQLARRRRMAAQPDQETSQPLQLGSEELPRYGRLPGRRQVEEKNPRRGRAGDGIKPAPQLIAVGGKNDGGLAPFLGEADGRVGKGTETG